MNVMPDPSAYRERPSVVTGVTVWTRVTDGSTSSILPDGCIDVLWDGRELTIAGPDTIAHCVERAERHTRTRPCVSPLAWHRSSSVSPADALRDQRPSSPT